MKSSLITRPVRWTKNHRAGRGAVQTLQLLSESLRDLLRSKDSSYWVNIKYLRQLVNNKNAFKIYLGLIYQEAINDYDDVQFTIRNIT